MTRARLLQTTLLLAAITGSVALFARAHWQDDFPHDQHAGLFPLCIGCHEGIPTGDVAEFYPDPQVCAGCHDGERERRVEWTGPTRPITNLDFDHPTHQAEMQRHEGRELDCSECHTRAGEPRMAVRLASARRCIACHAHAAQDHFVDADCATCHLPLAETRFAAARVAALPRPPSHDLPHFLTDVHGSLARTETERCATCHTRELCASCHVEVQRVAEIGRIPPAGPAVGLPAFTARYPLPISHLQPGWEEEHGAVASVAACATCHTRESCLSCHTDRIPRVVAQHPRRAEVAAPGAQVAMRAPESHASAFFAVRHGAIAAARPQNCATCHSQSRFCQDCHAPLAFSGEPSPHPANFGTEPEVSSERLSALIDFVKRFRPTGGSKAGVAGSIGGGAGGGGQPEWVAETYADTLPRVQVVRDTTAQATTRQVARPRARRFLGPPEFHPSNYLARHAAEAYAQRQECSSCHSTQVFCRDCHQQAGFGAVGRLGPGFHSAEPLWLFRHSQAARQTLESCTSCHTQRDCMQCHSQLGSFQVSPHGRNFDAERAQRRNPQICGACHIGDPIIRRTP
jgi:hypothetical protein